MDWKEEIGNQIKEGRKDQFLEREDLCKRVDLHVNMIGRYERGESGPELDVLIKLAIALEKWEFKIGEHVVAIKPAEGETPSSRPRQLRLEYGKEYVFVHGSPPKIPPSKEDSFIIFEQQKKTR